jgi:hypothetical protein
MTPVSWAGPIRTKAHVLGTWTDCFSRGLGFLVTVFSISLYCIQLLYTFSVVIGHQIGFKKRHCSLD